MSASEDASYLLPLDPDLLERRAREVAEPLELQVQSSTPTVVFVQLGQVAWGLPVEKVRSIERLRIAPLPASPPRVAGLAARRGRVVAVFDLRVVLELEDGSAPGDRHERDRHERDSEARALVLIAGNQDDEVGLLIDLALRAEALALDALLPAPVMPREGLLATLVRGAAPDGTPVLDLDALLDSELLTVQPAGGG